MRKQSRTWQKVLPPALVVGGLWRAALAVDISGVLPAAEDQPQTHALLIDSHGDILMASDGFGDEVYDIQAFLDTGTSGILLSQETQQGLGVNLATYNGQPVTFNDIAIGGVDTYSVSTPYTVAIAPFNADNDEVDYGNPPPPTSAYNSVFGPLEMEVNQVAADPLIGPLDIFGMAVLQNKYMVMDIRSDNSTDPDALPDTATYLYNPNSGYRPATLDTDPGIVPTQYHIKLSYASFDQFTQTNPAGAPPPAEYANPFIGPNPLKEPLKNPS